MSTETLIIKIAGADFSSVGDPVTRDAAIRQGSELAFDFGDSFCWPPQDDAPTNSAFENLVEANAQAVATGTALSFTPQNGFAFSAGSAQRIQVPDLNNVQGFSEGFLIVFWCQFGTQTQAALSEVVGLYDYGNSDGIFGISTQSPNIQFHVNGQIVRMQNWVPDGVHHQYALAWMNTPSGRRARVYIDGVLTNDEAAVNQTLTSPTTAPANGPGIGDVGSNGAAPFSVFDAYRLLAYDLDGLSEADVTKILKNDYAANNSRFS